MIQEVGLGTLLPIPCRICGSGRIPFTVAWGHHRLTCPQCGQVTEVEVKEERGAARIRTRAQEAR